MKKVTFLILFAMFSAGIASAQDDSAARFRKKYRNISFSSQTLGDENGNYEDKGSNFGFGFTTGRSYILHKNPIAGMIRIGIDATWFDINYGNWSEKIDDGKAWMHKLDIGMGVGPGIHVNPVSKLGIHVYFRYNPTFTATFDNYWDGLAIQGGYASYFTTGGAISWGVISLGAEARFGGGTYHSFKAPSIDDGGVELERGKTKHKLKGMRAYVSFRF